MSEKWFRKWGIIGLCAAVIAALNGQAFAEGLVIGGHLQSSYQYNFNKPKDAPIGGSPTGNQLRSFDANQDDDFNLNQVQLNAMKAITGEDHYGYGLKLLFGRDAEVLNAGSVGGAGGSVFVEEAYGMFTPTGFLHNLTFTGGKFVTPMGVEVVESPLNMHITEGFLFGLAEPVTHVGAKAALAIGDRITAMAGVVNGWDKDDDNNRGKTFLWQLATAPLKKTTLNFAGTYGPEADDQTHVKRTSLDLVAGFTGFDKWTLAFQANWGQDDSDAMEANVWKGVGLWAGLELFPWLNPGMRFEVFDDTQGGSRTGVTNAAGDHPTVKNFTLTNKFKLTEKSFVRAEYRHDFANMGAFQNDDGNTVSVQNTFGVDWVVLF